MTELEMAKRLLNEANIEVQQREAELVAHRAIFDSIDDGGVYEWVNCSDEPYPMRREVAKQTAKQIRLKPTCVGGKEKHLPRQRLQAVELVPEGKGWWDSDFLLGWVLRPMVKEQLDKASERLRSSRCNLTRIQNLMAAGRVVLDHDVLHSIHEIISSTNTVLERSTEDVDWVKEGF